MNLENYFKKVLKKMKKFNLKNISRLFLVTLLAMISASCASTIEMYRRTPVGEVEVKEIPKMKAYTTSVKGEFFNSNKELFGRLYRYMKYYSLEMTVPVVVKTDPPTMSFYVPECCMKKELRNMDDVKVVTMPAITVVSAGVRGKYDKRNYEKGKKMIEEWLKKNSDYVADGNYFITYWSCPSWWTFAMKGEVNLPVKMK